MARSEWVMGSVRPRARPTPRDWGSGSGPRRRWRSRSAMGSPLALAAGQREDAKRNERRAENDGSDDEDRSAFHGDSLLLCASMTGVRRGLSPPGWSRSPLGGVPGILPVRVTIKNWPIQPAGASSRQDAHGCLADPHAWGMIGQRVADGVTDGRSRPYAASNRRPPPWKLMATKTRATDEARRLWTRTAVETGDQLRTARHVIGISQAHLGSTIGVSQAEISRRERGRSRRLVGESLAIHAAAVRMKLSVKLWPIGGGVRDAAQARFVAAFVGRVGRQWRVTLDGARSAPR